MEAKYEERPGYTLIFRAFKMLPNGKITSISVREEGLPNLGKDRQALM